MARLRNLPPMMGTLDVRVAQAEPKQADPYYQTVEHQAWRRAVIGRAGGRCQDPSCKTPHRIGMRLFADHVTELRDGGSPTDPANGRALCGACHTRKTAAARARRMARPT
jgi:5-methylcytosine-specific restriction protein A